MCVYTCVCVCVIGGYDVYDHITCFVHPCGHFLSVLMEVPSVRAVLFCVSVDIFPPMLSHLSGILSFCSVSVRVRVRVRVRVGSGLGLGLGLGLG